MSGFDDVVAILRKYMKLGFVDAENGTLLIGHTPEIAPRAYLHKIFPGLSASAVKELQRRLPVEIPGAYKDFLSRSNGLMAFGRELALHGFTEYASRDANDPQPFDIVTANCAKRSEAAARGEFFFGTCSRGESTLSISPEDFCVYQRNRDSGKVEMKWWDFWEMITTEVARLDAIYNGGRNPLPPEE